MTPSRWVYMFLREHERFRPTAYKPLKGDVWTIGFGHTAGTKQGDVCSYPLAIRFLESDVRGMCAAIAHEVHVELTQPQYDALVSFVFNVGAHAFEESTLLRKLNEGDYGGAASEFMRSDHLGSAVIDGLRERRQAEMARFLA